MTAGNRVALALGLGFILLGVGQFASSLFAGRCLDAGRAAEARLWSCHAAAATTLARFSGADRGEWARIAVERAVVLAETGDADRAGQVLSRLLADGPAGAGTDPALAVIAARLARLAPGSPAADLLRGAGG